MNKSMDSLTSHYETSLREYLNKKSEASLQRAYELGRSAIAEKLSVLDLAAVHHDALGLLLQDMTSHDQHCLVVERASEFLAESLSVFEMTQRGFRETIALLRRLNQALEDEVTERKRTEEALRHSLDELAVATNLYGAAEKERAKFEEANRIKDNFLARLSHELRTPLTSIVGWSHLLRSGKLDESDCVRALETIERNALAQERLVRDLLDISRLTMGKVRLDVKPLDLAPVIQAAVDTAAPSAKSRSIQLKCTFCRSDCTVLGDPNRLQQVMWNLFANAIKFTPKQGRVHVELKRSKGYCVVSVTDTGIGIAPNFLPHIFDRFTQEDRATSQSQSGLGIGLAIACHIVELHGGTIRAHSRGQDKGAKFVVSLPLYTALNGDQAKPIRTQKQPVRTRRSARLPE